MSYIFVKYTLPGLSTKEIRTIEAYKHLILSDTYVHA